MVSCTARPMVRFARLPCPKTLTPLFMPIALVPGPLQIMTGPTGIVVASTPCILNSSLHTASSAVIIQGKYSGSAPAITALIAIFSTVSSTKFGGAMATTSCGLRVVPVSMRSTRSGVGGMTGKPSVQPRVNIDSNSSSALASSTCRECNVELVKRTRSSSSKLGSTLSEPQPGRMTGRSAPRSVMPVNFCHASLLQPKVRSTSSPFSMRSSVGTVSMS